MKCRRGQSSMMLEILADRFRGNKAISFLSIILFMLDSFLLIPFIRFSSEVVSQEQRCSSYSVTSSDSTSLASPSTHSSADT